MSDTELTDTEAARLRQLLHRAADSLAVDTPDADSIDLQPDAGRPGRGRWFFAAAAILAVVVGGAVWLQAGDDAERIDTGPAEPPVTVAPQVLEQAGVWRLPEGLDGYRIVGSEDAGSSLSSADQPGVLAVDDPDEPQRWLLVQAYDELGQLPPDARVVPLSDQVDVALVATTRSTWFRLAPTGAGAGPPGEVVVTGSALGIDEAELLALLTERFSTVDAVSTAGSSTASMEAVLDDAGFGGDRLVWQGGAADPGPGFGGEAIRVTLADHSDGEFVIGLTGGATPPWAQITRLRLVADLMSLPNAQDPGSMRRELRTRPDLGRGVIESTYTADGMETVRGLAVLTDDGVLINVSPVAMVRPDARTMPLLAIDEQLRIINSLRSMSEDEFRARLAELGAEFIGAESVGVTTTVVGEPGG
jgi:hypothetical protein